MHCSPWRFRVGMPLPSDEGPCVDVLIAPRAWVAAYRAADQVEAFGLPRASGEAVEGGGRRRYGRVVAAASAGQREVGTQRTFGEGDVVVPDPRPYCFGQFVQLVEIALDAAPQRSFVEVSATEEYQFERGVGSGQVGEGRTKPVDGLCRQLA